MLHVIYGLESRSLTPCHSGQCAVGCRNESGHLFFFCFFCGPVGTLHASEPREAATNHVTLPGSFCTSGNGLIVDC